MDMTSPPIPENHPRRRFLQLSALGITAATLTPGVWATVQAAPPAPGKIPVNAHLWVYASKFPPDWDATPVLNTVFSDLSAAGMDGVELMEGQLRHDDAVPRIKELSRRYQLPVSGSSYGVGFQMWDATQHGRIREDIQVVVPRLAAVGGKTFGISVGGKKGVKTGPELDAQARLLLEIRSICEDHGIVANLHNHTYEVENNLYDLKGTLERIPDFKLGPDLNWLIRAGVDPVEFIQVYGKQIVYLHIRDQYPDGTWTEFVGQGTTDFEAIAAALDEAGFSGQAAIELAFPEGFKPANTMVENWRKSREFVLQTFNW